MSEENGLSCTCRAPTFEPYELPPSVVATLSWEPTGVLAVVQQALSRYELVTHHDQCPLTDVIRLVTPSTGDGR